jgi:hypothetical protein
VVDDPSKTSVIAIKCTVCGAQSERHGPAMVPKNGKYVARKKRCRNKKCLESVCATPLDTAIKHVTYASLMTGISRAGKSYFRPYLKSQSASFDQGEANNLKSLVRQNFCVPNKSSEQVGRDDRFCSRTAYEPASPNQSTQTSYSEA